MLYKKTFRTIKKYLAQFISMVILLTLGIGVFLGFNMEWKSIEQNLFEFDKETSFADYDIFSDTSFTKTECDLIKSIDGVKEVSRVMKIDVDVIDHEDDAINLMVTENFNVSSFITISGKPYDSTNLDGIWLSDKYAIANNISLGDKLKLSFKTYTISLKVIGLIKASEYMVCIRDKTEILPDYASYGFGYVSDALYKKIMTEKLGFAFYQQLNVLSDLPKEEFINLANEKLEKTYVILSKNEKSAYAGPISEIDQGRTMGMMIPVLFLIIALLTMVTTMHRITTNEKVQIGILQALGFRNKKIRYSYNLYAIFIWTIGTFLGILSGILIAKLVFSENGTMGIYLDLPKWKLYAPWYFTFATILVLLILLLISDLSVKNILKGSAAETLMPFKMKKVKPIFFEKTKAFHKLSFGTRWNLRDITRHKSRTIMSIFGIFGSIIIILCVLGLRDSSKDFLNVYYDGTNNFQTKIFLSDNITDKNLNEALDKYGNDYSSSLNVELGEEAIGLDIYNIDHDLMKFVDTSYNYIKLTNNSAYICKRIADENNFKVGDTLTIKLFGTNKKINLKVGGVIRNINKSIVISTSYAKELNIEYKIDSIYSNLNLNEITKEDYIYKLQSKEQLINTFKILLKTMDMMIMIFIIAAIILGVIVLYNLGILNYLERYTELATLKVLGFKNKKISKLFIIQNLWTTIIGIIVGIPVANILLKYINETLLAQYEMMPSVHLFSYVISTILILTMMMLVSFMLGRKNKKIDMVSSLKVNE